MKKFRKIQILTTIISLVLLIIGVALIKFFKDNDLVLGIGFGIIIAVLGVFAVIEHKVNKEQKKYEDQEAIELQKKIREHFEELKDNDPKMALICDILNNEYIELTTIMNQANLEFSFDYDEDAEKGNYYEFSICSINANKKKFFYSSLYYEVGWFLVLNDEEDGIDVSNLSDSAIVDLFIEDIKKYIEVTNK